MHSKLLCLTLALLFVGSFVYAGMPEIEYHGTFYLYDFFWQNADFNEDNPTEDIADGDQFYYLHGDIVVDADFNAGVSTHIKVGGWGTFGLHPITITWNPLSDEYMYYDTPGQNVEVREAYVTLANLFGSPISFRAGKEHILYGDQVFDGGEDGAMGMKLSVNTDMVDADFFKYRLLEGGGCLCIGPGYGTIVPDDIDLFGTWITLKFMEGAVKVAPYGFYRTFSHYEDTFDSVTMDDAPMWVGARLDAAPIPGLNIAGEFTKMMGSRTWEDTDVDVEVDYTGMHYMGRLSYMPPGIPISFGGAYVSLSGDEYEIDTLTGLPDTGDENEAYESPIWGPYTFDFYKWWPGFGPAHTHRTVFGFTLVAPFDPMSTNINVINGNFAFYYGPFMLRGDYFKYSRNYVNDDVFDSNDMGMEISVLATYTYQKRITLGACGGMWTPGEYFEEYYADDDLEAMLGGYFFTYITF